MIHEDNQINIGGLYRHYKGGFYRTLCLARHSETEEMLVIYQALYAQRGIWARPASMWNEKVGQQGQCRRFTLVEENPEGWETL